MKYAILGLALAGLSQAAVNSTTVLIPSNITSTCSTFLASLNSDSALSSCVTPLINATASFSPTAAVNLTEDDVNYTLASICKTNAGCSDSTIRGWLANFYSQCYPELTSASGYNSQVRELYDILYVVNPLKNAVCSIDSSNQEYCINGIVAAEAASNSAGASNSTAAANSTAAGNNTLFVNFASTANVLSPVQLAAQNLYIEISSTASSLRKRVVDTVLARRAEAQSVNLATIVAPNATTYKNTNLPFLFLQPTMNSKALCTPCTREVLVAYVQWETQVPYALGLKQSPILGGQSALWSAINGTCGPAFINAIMSEVGSYASGNSSSGAESIFIGQSGIAGMTALVGVTFTAGLMALFV
ncbi:hypothetical protein CI109_105836 [Kwoniella shandongensis]|uniref:Uncharacterized protein n=1 Tax=Kwoniella shandongensis TaxID=1734106 RepID=A0A5M6BUU3_9TREE|nr:uncharacterized protein CI109_005729 [Kwoniella shandongensis]KAA5525981.1 hypothetical protein CI109_005729 [Kwoniella shandongensis]